MPHMEGEGTHFFEGSLIDELNPTTDSRLFEGEIDLGGFGTPAGTPDESQTADQATSDLLGSGSFQLIIGLLAVVALGQLFDVNIGGD